ncbi:UbiA prenyltransferase family protein [Comamonas piscis]|uniref:UbiA prenyltransferase family protein n=1 Tax=Comamonas piscis TaxID=1562974 RepID=A0A7G5EHL8_9BURK|nr:UbiA family prenyltransferase [Comamonas piscis]QMV73493.1 UbiA prenyltransferase family protein [Comamonas piscis]WSO31910.1 UbiA family prenyltransferase [Comamonas piscis]
MAEARQSSAGARQLLRPQWLRLLASIRLGEVLVLQGTPLMGAILALGTLASWHGWAIGWQGLWLVTANLLFVAHVFVANDWAGIDADLRDPQRQGHTFVNQGVGRRLFGWLGVGLFVGAMLALLPLGDQALLLGLALCAVSALYSLPPWQLKGRPLWNSLMHLLGGSLHFLLGWVAFAPIHGSSIAISVFFGLVFAAGHLVHEARGVEGDRLNGIQTNAVRFGAKRCFAAAFVLFSAAYLLLAILCLRQLLPTALLLAVCLYPLHVWATWQAYRQQLSFASLLRLQTCYRAMYALTGLLMLMAVLFERAIG